MHIIRKVLQIRKTLPSTRIDRVLLDEDDVTLQENLAAMNVRSLEGLLSMWERMKNVKGVGERQSHNS